MIVRFRRIAGQTTSACSIIRTTTTTPQGSTAAEPMVGAIKLSLYSPAKTTPSLHVLSCRWIHYPASLVMDISLSAQVSRESCCLSHGSHCYCCIAGDCLGQICVNSDFSTVSGSCQQPLLVGSSCNSSGIDVCVITCNVEACWWSSNLLCCIVHAQIQRTVCHCSDCSGSATCAATPQSADLFLHFVATAVHSSLCSHLLASALLDCRRMRMIELQPKQLA